LDPVIKSHRATQEKQGNADGVQQPELTDAKNTGVLDPRLNRLIHIFWQASQTKREELLILAEGLVHDRD